MATKEVLEIDLVPYLFLAKAVMIYFLRSKKVGTLDWARPFPADASSTSRANKGPASPAQARAYSLPAKFKCDHVRFQYIILRFLKVRTLDWARPFPADASSTLSAGNSRVTESQ